MRRVFADAFYWIAVADESDEWHERAIRQTPLLEDARLVTTEAVLIEFVNFFSRHDADLRRAVVQIVHDTLVPYLLIYAQSMHELAMRNRARK